MKEFPICRIGRLKRRPIKKLVGERFDSIIGVIEGQIESIGDIVAPYQKNESIYNNCSS